MSVVNSPVFFFFNSKESYSIILWLYFHVLYITYFFTSITSEIQKQILQEMCSTFNLHDRKSVEAALKFNTEISKLLGAETMRTWKNLASLATRYQSSYASFTLGWNSAVLMLVTHKSIEVVYEGTVTILLWKKRIVLTVLGQ